MKSCCFWPFKFCFAETPPRDFAVSQQTMFGLIERYFPVNFSKFLRTPFYRALLAPTFVVNGNKKPWYYLLFLKKFLFNTFLIVCRFDFSPNSKSHVDQIDEIQAKIVTLSKRIKFLLWRHCQGDKFDLKLQVICTSFVEGRGKVPKIGQNKSFLKSFWNSALWKSVTNIFQLLRFLHICSYSTESTFFTCVPHMQKWGHKNNEKWTKISYNWPY